MEILNNIHVSFLYECVSVRIESLNTQEGACGTLKAIGKLLRIMSYDPLHYILDVTVTERMRPGHILYRARMDLRSHDEPIVFDLAHGDFERVMAA